MTGLRVPLGDAQAPPPAEGCEPHSLATVVVGMDGSTRSGDALALAVRLAEPLRARLSAVWVDPGRALAHSKHEQCVAEVADSVHMEMRAAGLAVEDRRLRVVSDRSPAAGLQRMAAREGAVLIVVGASRRSRVGRVVPGGTAERLLAGARCAVAVAPRDYSRDRDELESVGCAFDGSSESQAALGWAAGLTRALAARLRIVSVHRHLPPVTVPAGAGLPLASVNDALRQDLCRRLEDAEAELRGKGLRVTPAMLNGDPAAALTAASARLDLLVVGSRGHGPLSAALLGSVSTALVRTASCPLVVVPRSPAPWAPLTAAV